MPAQISSKAVNVLRDLKTQGVFKAVAEPRTISFRDLKNSLPDEENLQQSISDLLQADLIGEKTSVIPDFSTLYVTADGLNAVRALKKS